MQISYEIYGGNLLPTSLSSDNEDWPSLIKNISESSKVTARSKSDNFQARTIRLFQNANLMTDYVAVQWANQDTSETALSTTELDVRTRVRDGGNLLPTSLSSDNEDWPSLVKNLRARSEVTARSKSDNFKARTIRLFQNANLMTDYVAVQWANQDTSETALSTTELDVRTRVSLVLQKMEQLELKGRTDNRFSRLAAQEAMFFIESNFQKSPSTSMREINFFLQNINIGQLSSISLVGIFRSTYRFSNLLPSWTPKYDAAIERVKELGKEPSRLFFGLPH